MKCLILVGGFGTRLRPLTLSKPKPLVEFCNRAILEHQIAAAVDCGVDHVILAVGYRPEELEKACTYFEEKFKIKVTMSLETEPLGTAGPVRLAKDLILETNEPFFVFNSDVICEYQLKELLSFHKEKGAEVTICLTKVADPSKYGVVLYDENGRVQSFVEKPQVFVGDRINAGMYIMNTSVVDRIPDKPTMFETQVFPILAEEQRLFCFTLAGYWADIGQPKDYLAGLGMHLAAISNRSEVVAGEVLAKESDFPGVTIKGNVLAYPGVTIGAGSVIGPDVTLGKGVVVGEGCRVLGSAILDNSKIQDYAYVSGSIIGWDSKVGKWSRVQPMTVVGADVDIKPELCVNGAFVLPHKGIKQSVLEKGTIIM